MRKESNGQIAHEGTLVKHAQLNATRHVTLSKSALEHHDSA